MKRFISQIRVDGLLHLRNLVINISNPECAHLILTGRNGSGKSVLLNAIADALCGNAHPALELQIDDLPDDAVLAYYSDNRMVRFSEMHRYTPYNSANVDIRGYANKEFLLFLANLKVYQAEARNNGDDETVDRIDRWFGDFENLLRVFFEDSQLSLTYNFGEFTFYLCTEGKEFKFTQMSSGMSSVLDIVADLMLRMNDAVDIPADAYMRSGIVLIDEPETHLHLSLQRIILPTLTRLFPNIQFIVATHSPLVLASLCNATTFDMQHRIQIENLTQYSWESLTQGYFGVPVFSSHLERRLEQLKRLFEQTECSTADQLQIDELVKAFKSIPEPVAPQIVGAFRELMIKYIQR